MAKSLYKKLPESPGVYIMRNARGRILYIGKAGNLRRRVSSYFQKAHDIRIERLVSEIKKIDYRKTDSALEALILEAKLIREHTPPYNVREKDDKSFLYVQITDETFPRVLLVRGHDKRTGKNYGPFTSASNLREALKILRRIFPWSAHPERDIGRFSRPCLDYQIGLCPGTCAGLADHKEYRRNIHNLILFLEGRKRLVLKALKAEMKAASRVLDFERAQKLRGRIFALQHVEDVALLSENKIDSPEKLSKPAIRIEGYDISNISGTSSVGSMAVFTDGESDKAEYRKFRIRTIMQSDDVGMMKEMLRRRFKNDWPLPSLVLVDGGKPQANAAMEILDEFNLSIPVIGLAKGPERKRNDVIGPIPKGIDLATLIRVRDEAHRFAISYHRTLRGRNFMK